MEYTLPEIAKMIDHSLLNPRLTEENLIAGIKEAVAYNVASVCIMPYYLARCAALLKESSVKASTTIGFPHGGQTLSVKVHEIKQALEDGGEELDMVINISKALSDDWGYVEKEIREAAGLVHEKGQKIKIIFENCYLEDRHKIRLCEICGDIGVDWVKTSTGFGTSGATVHDVTLMRKHSPSHVQVKAAGGIRSLETLVTMKNLGATRIGASKTKEILDECKGFTKNGNV
jgi:deoxyribose-phosphate aldolase